jgi:hypothetical protein
MGLLSCILVFHFETSFSTHTVDSIHHQSLGYYQLECVIRRRPLSKSNQPTRKARYLRKVWCLVRLSCPLVTQSRKMPSPAIRCVKEGCDKWAVSGSRYCASRTYAFRTYLGPRTLTPDRSAVALRLGISRRGAYKNSGINGTGERLEA